VEETKWLLAWCVFLTMTLLKLNIKKYLKILNLIVFKFLITIDNNLLNAKDIK